MVLVNQLINNQIIQYLMLSSSAELFFQIAQKVHNKQYYEQLINHQLQFFDLQPYKIDKLYAETAKKIYKQILAKYSYTKELTIDSNNWYQNQRKLFIWFIVCFLYQENPSNPAIDLIDWKMLSDAFFSKNPDFLKFQFLNIIKNKKRINWTQQQDELLTKITNQLSPGKWNDISKLMFYQSLGKVFRTPKHCRERWLNHLDQNKNKGKWTSEEDLQICSYVLENGKRWSKLVPVLQNKRTQHMIKNRFNSLLTKKKKNKKQKEEDIIKKIISGIKEQIQMEKRRPDNNEDFYGKAQNFKYQQKQQKQYELKISLKQSAERLDQFSHFSQKKLSFQTSIDQIGFKNVPEPFFYMPSFHESFRFVPNLVGLCMNQNNVCELSKYQKYQNYTSCTSLSRTTEIQIEVNCDEQKYQTSYTSAIHATCQNKKLEQQNQEIQLEQQNLKKTKLFPVYIIKGNFKNRI